MSALAPLQSILILSCLPSALSFSIRELMQAGGKRGSAPAIICPTWHPFACPSGECVPIKYLCDGSADCEDAYDENNRLCTAVNRPPVEETATFLQTLLVAHGKDFLAKVFGSKAHDNLAGMGGVERVAVALSQAKTADQFASDVGLGAEDERRMVTVMEGILQGSYGELNANEAGDFRFFVQKLQETGFF